MAFLRKVLIVNHKVKIMNFRGGISERILEKLDDIIKEKPDDLIVHAGTNGIYNNGNLSTHVKKIFNKISKESPSSSIEFSSTINRKEKTNIQETLTDTNTRLKNFCMQKRISFIDNSGIKEFHLGNRKLHLNKKGNSAFKFTASYKQDRLIFFPYDLVTVNDCLCDTLEKAGSGANSSLQNIRKDDFNKLIFAHLNITQSGIRSTL